MINLKYFFGAIITIPLLPIMYFQGKKIRSSVPALPEATGTEGKAEKNPNRTLKLITIGESTIAGVGVDTHEEGFTGTIAKELSQKLDTDIEWKVYARSGYTARLITQRIIPKISEQTIDLIIIGLGGNDAFTLNTPTKWKSDIQKLILALKNKFGDVPIAFTNMPPIKEFPAFTELIKFTVGNLVEILGKELKQVTQNQQNVYYYARTITLKSWIKELEIEASSSDFFSDGVHPSKLTYRAWAMDFANYLVRTNVVTV